MINHITLKLINSIHKRNHQESENVSCRGEKDICNYISYTKDLYLEDAKNSHKLVRRRQIHNPRERLVKKKKDLKSFGNSSESW